MVGGMRGGGGQFGSSTERGVSAKSTNIFAALEGTKRKKSIKKKGDRDKDKDLLKAGEPKSGAGASTGDPAGTGRGGEAAEGEGPEKQPGWLPGAPVTVSSWADCEDDDEEYFATTVPVFPGMEGGAPGGGGEGGEGGGGERGEAEEEGDEHEEEHADMLGEEEEEEDHEEEEEGHGEEEEGERGKGHAGSVGNGAVRIGEGSGGADGAKGSGGASEEQGSAGGAAKGGASLPGAASQKDPEQQLSKKERKQKEMEELEAVLAELGINSKPATPGMPPVANFASAPSLFMPIYKSLSVPLILSTLCPNSLPLILSTLCPLSSCLCAPCLPPCYERISVHGKLGSRKFYT